VLCAIRHADMWILESEAQSSMLRCALECAALGGCRVLMAELGAGNGPASGPLAQGWGPLRVWPGGLCLSRAVGDFDVGAVVLAVPHIMQVNHPTPPPLWSASLHVSAVSLQGLDSIAVSVMASMCLIRFASGRSPWHAFKDLRACFVQ
jgi:hypothetical protein